MCDGLASLYVITYNHSKFVEDAINGALSQTYSPLQIVISDDASTDDTCEKIDKIIKNYKGSHTIKYIKNEKNIGIAQHINNVLGQCDGKYIIASAGDDVSENNRVEILCKHFNKDPELMLLESYITEINDVGEKIEINILNDNDIDDNILIKKWSFKDRIKNKNIPYTHGASFAYKRELLELFPDKLDKSVIFEDNVFDWRAELTDGIGLLRMPLVRHRNHSGQATKINNKTKKSVIENIKKMTVNNLLTTKANIDDLELWYSQNNISYIDYNNAKKWLAERYAYYEKKNKIINSEWIGRLYLIINMYLNNKKTNNCIKEFTKKEIISLILP
jgi:glycosyltransferase involved in cell wall biosynthesis